MARRPPNSVSSLDLDTPTLPLSGFRRHLEQMRAQLPARDPLRGKDDPPAGSLDRRAPVDREPPRRPTPPDAQAKAEWPTRGQTDPRGRD